MFVCVRLVTKEPAKSLTGPMKLIEIRRVLLSRVLISSSLPGHDPFPVPVGEVDEPVTRQADAPTH